MYLYSVNICTYFLAACGILVSWPGMELGSLAMKVWSPNHWTNREFPINPSIRGEEQLCREGSTFHRAKQSRSPCLGPWLLVEPSAAQSYLSFPSRLLSGSSPLLIVRPA